MTENEKILVDSARLDSGKVIKNPTDEFFINFLRDYYTQTQDGQYLFGSMQPGRRPDRAFYIVPECYKLGKGQKKFDG